MKDKKAIEVNIREESKILVIHNYYDRKYPSGENKIVDEEVAYLKSRGYQVIRYEKNTELERYKSKLKMLMDGINSVWNPFSARDVRKIVKEDMPNIINVHNVFPLISASIFREIKGGRRIITLHNYRYFCAAGVPMRDGKVCTKCIEKRNPIYGIIYACYKKSRLMTVPVVLNIWIIKKLNLINKYFDRVVVFSRFQKDMLLVAGIDRSRIFIKPNCMYKNPIKFPIELNEKKQIKLLFVGRMSKEKGVEILLSAMQEIKNKNIEKVSLTIIGDGPEKSSLEKKYGYLKSVRFLGKLEHGEVLKEVASCNYVIIPSICYEGFPLVLREAFAYGKPSIVSNIGPMAEMIVNDKTGYKFNAGDYKMLSEIICNLTPSGDAYDTMCENVKSEYRKNYSLNAVDDLYELLFWGENEPFAK